MTDEPSVRVPSIVVGVRVEDASQTIVRMEDELQLMSERVLWCKGKWLTAEVERKREMLEKKRVHSLLRDLRYEHESTKRHVGGLIVLLDKIVNDIEFTNNQKTHADRMRTNINSTLDERDVRGPRLSRKRPRCTTGDTTREAIESVDSGPAVTERDAATKRRP